MTETLVLRFVKNALAVTSPCWNESKGASRLTEVKLPQVSYLPLTCKLHRHLYAPLLQLFQLVTLILSVSCVSPSGSYQNMEGAQAEGLSYWSSMKLLLVCNREKKKDFRRQNNYTVKKKLLCAPRDVSLGDENVIRNLWRKVHIEALECSSYCSFPSPWNSPDKH